MVRFVSWLANAALFVLCCFLLANTANTVFAALLSEPVPPPPPAAAGVANGERQWADMQVILDRNLFNASLLGPPAPPPGPTPDELAELEASRLPVTLLGTMVALGPGSESLATIQDDEARKALVLRVGDPLKGRAEVLRIERRRVVLLENGKPRELVLDEEDSRPAVARRPARRPARSNRAASRAQRVRELAKNRFSLDAGTADEIRRNPATLFAEAPMQPKYDDQTGQMVGLEVMSVKPGSLFEEVGIESGDVITEVNGISITSPEESSKILTEWASAEEFQVAIEGKDVKTFSRESFE